MYFADPPARLKTKGGGGTRTVLSGIDSRPPDDVLKLVSNEAERNQLIQAHAAWDKEATPFVRQWQALAQAGR